jgi:hypothetical protein
MCNLHREEFAHFCPSAFVGATNFTGNLLNITMCFLSLIVKILLWCESQLRWGLQRGATLSTFVQVRDSVLVDALRRRDGCFQVVTIAAQIRLPGHELATVNSMHM